MRLHRQFGGLLAAVAALPWAAQVHGQFVPYAQPQYQTPYPAYQAPQGQPVYGQQQAYPRYAMALQNENLPLTPPSAESVAPGAAQVSPPSASPAVQQGVPAYAPTPAMQPTPMGAESYGGYMPSTGAAGCNCNTPAATSAYQPYASAPAAGCATGACDGGYAGYGGSGVAEYGACGGYSTYGCGIGGRTGGGLVRPRGCNYWFGGVYGLLMQRSNDDKHLLTMAVTPASVSNNYAPSSSTVLTTDSFNYPYQGGVEFVLGRTFGGGAVPAYGGCDPCGDSCGSCGTCCSPPCWGIMASYWNMFSDTSMVSYTDNGSSRTYSMVYPRGLEYDAGSGYRPLYDYFDSAMPINSANDIRVDYVRARSTFEAQNLEINLLRLPIWGGGVAVGGIGAAAYGGGFGGMAGCGGCDGGCGGCNAGGCGCGSRFSYVTLCGFRYLQFDERFLYGVDYTNTTTSATGFMNYNARTTNDLYGFQLGGNGFYRLGCKWGLNLGSNVGIYGNDIDVYQSFDSPTGNIRYIQAPNSNFTAHASQTNFAMVAELRAGISYQMSCHCQLYGGWRVIGVSGVALATNQMPPQYIDPAQVNSYVNSNSSLFLNGLQTGVIWTY